MARGSEDILILMRVTDSIFSDSSAKLLTIREVCTIPSAPKRFAHGISPRQVEGSRLEAALCLNLIYTPPSSMSGFSRFPNFSSASGETNTSVFLDLSRLWVGNAAF